MYQVQHKEILCRSCRQTIHEDDHICKHCQIEAPGIFSQCPKCKSKNYVYHKYGYNYLRGIAAAAITALIIPAGPIYGLLGFTLGFFGANNTECICLDCKQGWFPFEKDKQFTRFNTMVGEKGKLTRQFKRIPENCYKK